MRTLAVQGLLSLAVSLGPLVAEDLIDMRQLGKRGAILEPGLLPLARGDFKVEEAQGLGDFNGDGFDDLGVIYQSEPSEAPGPWRVAVVYGRRDLSGRHLLDELSQTVVFRIDNPLVREGCTRPNHVHPVGDLNGDGLEDFMVGFACYRFSEDQANTGAAFLVYGNRDLVGQGFIEEIGAGVPGVVFWSSDPTHNVVGFNYRKIGDFNGDGRDDLAISASLSDVGMWKNAGVLFVLFDTRNLPPRVDLARVGKDLPGLVLRGTTELETPDGPIIRTSGSLGDGIEAAGDFNGDGLADFLVNAREIFTLYLVRGSANSPPMIDLGDLDEAGLRRLGITVFHTPFDNRIFAVSHQFAGVGDLNGDGRSEIVLGVSRRDPPDGQNPQNSEVYLFWGREEFPAVVEMASVPPGLATVFRPLQWGDFFGYSLSPAGDLNGDSIPDFLIGAPRAWRDGITNVGEAYAIFARADFPSEVRF